MMLKIFAYIGVFTVFMAINLTAIYLEHGGLQVTAFIFLGVLCSVIERSNYFRK
jgi:hypothetical protein